VFNITVITTNGIYIIALIFAYLDPESNYIISSSIFFAFVLCIFTLQTFGLVFSGSIAIYACALYCKMKFNEIYGNISKLINNYIDNKYTNILLMKSFIEHNYYERKVYEMNHTFRCIIFILYYVGTPGFHIGLYGVYQKETQFYARIFLIIVNLCFTLIVLIKIMSTWVINFAHKPYPLLYSYLCRRQSPQSLRMRLKILVFIERLSGPDIGFYCYDLFPMNNYEFYQYMYISGANYILLNTLF